MNMRPVPHEVAGYLHHHCFTEPMRILYPDAYWVQTKVTAWWILCGILNRSILIPQSVVEDQGDAAFEIAEFKFLAGM